MRASAGCAGQSRAGQQGSWARDSGSDVGCPRAGVATPGCGSSHCRPKTPGREAGTRASGTVTHPSLSLPLAVRVRRPGLRPCRRGHPADLPAPDVHRGLPEPHLPLQEQRGLHGPADRQPQEVPAPPGLQRDRAPVRGQQPLHLHRHPRRLHGERPQQGPSLPGRPLLRQAAVLHGSWSPRGDAPLPLSPPHPRVTPEPGARQ